jgi:hypothetical protein
MGLPKPPKCGEACQARSVIDSIRAEEAYLHYVTQFEDVLNAHPATGLLLCLFPTKNSCSPFRPTSTLAWDGLPSISHDVALDTAGPALAASVIAFVLEPQATSDQAVSELLQRLCQHIYGRKGDTAATADERKLVEALQNLCLTEKFEDHGGRRLWRM